MIRQRLIEDLTAGNKNQERKIDEYASFNLLDACLFINHSHKTKTVIHIKVSSKAKT